MEEMRLEMEAYESYKRDLKDHAASHERDILLAEKAKDAQKKTENVTRALRKTMVNMVELTEKNVELVKKKGRVANRIRAMKGLLAFAGNSSVSPAPEVRQAAVVDPRDDHYEGGKEV